MGVPPPGTAAAYALVMPVVVSAIGVTTVPVVQLKVVVLCGYIAAPKRKRLLKLLARVGTTWRAMLHLEGLATVAAVPSGAKFIEPDLSCTMNSTGSSAQGTARAAGAARRSRAIRLRMPVLSAVHTCMFLKPRYQGTFLES